MIDHVGIRVSDLTVSTAFYRQALAPLGYTVLMEFDFGVGLGHDGKPDFWLYPGGPGGVETHVAMSAQDRATVDAFSAAAQQAGAAITISPRLHPEYHPTYYAAFVTDPDGHNLEAVCHRPE